MLPKNAFKIAIKSRIQEVQWTALYFCMAKIGKSTSSPQLYANGGRLILYVRKMQSTN